MPGSLVWHCSCVNRLRPSQGQVVWMFMLTRWQRQWIYIALLGSLPAAVGPEPLLASLLS